jgi:hypothetical protein
MFFLHLARPLFAFWCAQGPFLFTANRKGKTTMTNHPPNAPARAKTANRPIEIIRDGALKATIWENEGENGLMYSTTLARTYHANDGSLKDAHSFSGSELLRVAELARQAYAAINAIRRDHAQALDPAWPEPQHEESLTDAYRNAL